MTVHAKLAIVLLAVCMVVGSQSPGDAAPSSEPSILELADEHIVCEDIEGEQYCTHLGFTDIQKGSREWVRMWRAAERERPSDTGEMPFGEYLRSFAELPKLDRSARVTDELEGARRAIGKVKLGNYVGLDIPIPEAFFAEYPELGIVEGTPHSDALRTAAATGQPLDLSGVPIPTGVDVSEEVLASGSAVDLDAAPMSVPWTAATGYLIWSAYREQEKSYYCGPATFQSIDGGDDGGFESQAHWASNLGTTTSGTAMSSIIAGINSWTAWDAKAGTYTEVSSLNKGASWYFDQHQINIGIYGAILVEHVRLERAFFPYLAKDHGGHFQTGRGYSRNTNTIAIFEPYDERDWTTGGNATGTRQYPNYVDLYNANQHYAAHGASYHVDLGM